MQRVDTATEEFIGGDVTTGTEGTILKAPLMNSWQEELCQTVEGLGGLALDDADDTQIESVLIRLLQLNKRPIFEYTATTQITISPFTFFHNGTKNQTVHGDTPITYTFANLAVSDWSYLYLDDSAIVTAADNIITTDELIDSVVEPVWSDAKRGWYNGEDLCIFAVLTDSSSNILEFHHVGDAVWFATSIINLAWTDIDNTWTDVTLTAPCFARNILASFLGDAVNDINLSYATWRTNGQAASGGHAVGNYYDVDAELFTTSMHVFSDNSQIIEIKNSFVGDHRLRVDTDGWCMPHGI
jgi:hypothetical protein